MDTQALACGILAACRQDVAGERSAVSPALAAAQKKLERLRLACRPNLPQSNTATVVQFGRFNPPDSAATTETRPKTLPAHLGWHSPAVTRAYHQALRNQRRQIQEPLPPPILTKQPTPPPQPEVPTNSKQHIRLSPDIALAILRSKLAAPARVWLLLRHLDAPGKGWVSADKARELLTGKQSPSAVCGKRQLRNLLAAGDGLFWERDEERIWLRSMARVAVSLGLERLNGRPVRLPLPILLDSIGTIRAHFYAAFHSSRNGRNEPAQSGSGKPISRKRLKALSSATRRTQRLYERKSGVRPQANYAVGQHHSTEAAQELAWEQGHAAFHFQDKKGFIGKSGQEYLAWQLPNSYDGPHETASKGHQRHINRQLADLLNKGITGNGEELEAGLPDGTDNVVGRPIFYHNGSAAAKEFNRTPERDFYWRSRIGDRRYRLWHFLPAIERPKSSL